MSLHSANDRLRDATVRHQVYLRRYATGEVEQIIALLEEADADLVLRLRTRLARLEGSPNLSTLRAQEVLRSVRDIRAEALREVRRRVREDMGELVKVEAEQALRTMSEALPVELDMVSPSVPTLRAAAMTQPFGGQGPLSDWFGEFAAGDQRRIRNTIQMGIVKGEPVDDMVRRLAGTRRAGYADGVLAISRRSAESVVRTAVNHVSNVARKEVVDANADLVLAEQWVATLDGRACPVCGVNDGAMEPLGDNELPRGARRVQPAGARPPLHRGDRCLFVPVLRGEGVDAAMGQRPMVRDSRTRRVREADFRGEAREQAGDKWDDMSAKQRNAAVREVRGKWAEENVGTVPNATTYGQWLKSQPAEFVSDVLGPTRARLFRKGELQVDQFIDRQGVVLSLSELARLRPQAFERAGLEPEDFR